MIEVVIHFVNGSSNRIAFKHIGDARALWQRGISYTGGRVRRVEAYDRGVLIAAIWDISWSAESKRAGLRT